MCKQAGQKKEKEKNMFLKHSRYLTPTCKIFYWAVMVEGYVLVNRRPPVLWGGSFYSKIGRVDIVPASGLNFAAMAREGIVLFVLDGANSNPVARHLRRESPFSLIFGAYVNMLGYDGKVTRFFYLNVVVKWDSMLEDIGLPDEGRINVVLFGWLFSVADLVILISVENPLLWQEGSIVGKP